jgi:tetratricopeptide (TPR) repeat protein
VFLVGCNTPKKRAESLYRKGLQQTEQGQFPQALQQFRYALLHNPDHIGARIELGILLCRYGQYAESVKHLLRARESDTDNIQSLVYLGYAHQQLGYWGLAEQYYVQALQRVPNLVDVRFYLADVLEAQDKLQAAAQTLQEILVRYPEHERAAILQARINVLQHPESPKAHRELAAIYLEHGEVVKGVKAYERSTSLDPADPVSLARFGRFCAEREQFELAATYLSRAIEFGLTGEPEVWVWLGKSQDVLGNFQDAVEAYQSALRQRPELAEIRQRLVTLLEQMGRQNEAAELLEQGFYTGHLTKTNAVWREILRLRGQTSEKAVVQLTSTASEEFLIDVVVNESLAATFLLDPQSEYTIISEEFAQRLNILLSANMSVVHFYFRGRLYTPYLVNLPSVKVGDLAVRNVKTLILDLSDVVPPIDGVLGGNFLKHFQVEIQNEHQLFVLTKLFS